MKKIIDIGKISSKEIRRMIIVQLRKGLINALVSFMLITFVGNFFPASGIWQIFVVILSILFALRVMINCIKIDTYARELRHRRN